jgi:hypothetical protein
MPTGQSNLNTYIQLCGQQQNQSLNEQNSAHDTWAAA